LPIVRWRQPLLSTESHPKTHLLTKKINSMKTQEERKRKMLLVLPLLLLPFLALAFYALGGGTGNVAARESAGQNGVV
jgi:hypothetical protein